MGLYRTTSKKFWRGSGRKSLERQGSGIRRDRMIDADVSLSPDVYLFLMQQQAENPGKEIAGFGVIDDSGILSWASIVAVGAPSSVNVSALDAAWSEEEAVSETGKSSNVQIHSHPGLGCFWSGTDTNDQYNRVDAIREYAEEGEYWFLVFDSSKIEFLSRKTEWNKSGITYNDGIVWVGNQDIGRKGYNGAAITETKAAGVTTSGYGQGYTQYGTVTTHPSAGKPVTTWDSKKKDDEAAKQKGFAGDLIGKLSAYAKNHLERPDMESINNWEVFQAIIDLSFIENCSARLVAEKILVHEIANDKHLSGDTPYEYPRYGVVCQVTSMGHIPVGKFLEAFIAVCDTPVTSQSPGDILLAQAFDTDKSGELSYAFVAHRIVDMQNKLQQPAINKYLSHNGDTGKIKRDDFAYWARTQDHACVSSLSNGFYELRNVRFSKKEVETSGMRILRMASEVLREGKNGIWSVSKEPHTSNFDLIMIRRALAIVKPELTKQFDQIVSTVSSDGFDGPTVVKAILEFCHSAAISDELMQIDDIRRIYDTFGSISVADSVLVFHALDTTQKSLPINDQWVLSLFFTGSSGLMPLPLVVSDVLDLQNGAWTQNELDEIFISAMSIGIGRMMLMAFSNVNLDETIDIMDMRDGTEAAMLDEESVTLMQAELI